MYVDEKHYPNPMERKKYIDINLYLEFNTLVQKLYRGLNEIYLCTFMLRLIHSALLSLSQVKSNNP